MSDPRRALVVDDNDINRRLARAMLTRLGWTVDEAESGEAALDACQNTAYALVLLDISMPGLCGEKTCARLRERGYPTRIIAYTAHAYAADREKFMASGFDDILVKPISLQALESVLRGL